MAQAKLIVPEHYIKPRCEAKISSVMIKWYKDRGRLEPARCNNMASIKINGKCLCRKHAGMVALDILLNEGVAKDGKS